ncbi:MAG: LacI family DNA-binding transcriptional regulator, partial [Lachnospiraceae bacterium]|nr:LacI family DNA-binding transcriptional regulator [Lachnospiraceae bacterium]
MIDGKLTIGVLIGNIFADHTDDMLNGIMHGAIDQDINIMFFMGAHANCFDNYYTKTEDGKFFYHFNGVFDYANLSKVDILIVAYSTFYLYMEESKEEFFKRFDGLSVPLIIIGDQYKDYMNVITDNKDGIKKCMNHLIKAHGYKKIVYLSGPIGNNRDASERLEAYQEVMSENGFEVTDKMIAYGDYSPNSAPLFGKLLDDNPGVEAVVCANDTMAISGYAECHKRGLIPGLDIAIT